MHDFDQHQHERSLVSIRREAVDDHSIQGFVLASGNGLVVLQYVYDFHLDGLLVLGVDDITEVRCTATDRFQRDLLAQEGLMQQVPFGAAFDLRGWRSIIEQLAGEHALMIVECERGDDGAGFFIGRLAQAEEDAIFMEHFSGVGRWAPDVAELAYADITACQVATNYAKVYERYFARNAHWAASHLEH
jgi:hypothetical protein